MRFLYSGDFKMSDEKRASAWRRLMQRAVHSMPSPADLPLRHAAPSRLLRATSRLAWAPVFVGLLMSAAPVEAKDFISPLAVSAAIPVAYPVNGTDDRQHLVYELVLLNTGVSAATLRKIEVVAGDAPATVLATFEGPALIRHLRSPARVPVTKPEIAVDGTRLLLVDFTLPRGSRPPATLLHRVELSVAGFRDDPVGPYAYTTAPMAVGNDIAVIGRPLSGKHWVAVNGCCAPVGVHRGAGISVNGHLHYGQRFAIDWMRLDDEGRFTAGNGKKVDEYASYGEKVLAVADGTVIGTLASMEDQVPGEMPDPKTITIDNIEGNHIVLDLGQGRYAFYAHLQKNSLKVSKGDRVKRGQVLALLGNTGNSGAPHLHFHLMDGPSVLGSSGIPYVFDQFEVAGLVRTEQFESSDSLEGVWNGGLLPAVSSRKLEFPVDLSIVNFGD